ATLEDGSPGIVPNWASGFSAGPANEAGQTLLGYLVTNDNNALFAVQPAIDTNGTLTYTLAANVSGIATVTVRVRDNGGTDNGAIDTGSAQTFTIPVLSVNHSPSSTKCRSATAGAGGGGRVIAGWASFLSAAANNEAGQTFSFLVTNNNNALFAVQPAIDSS